MLLIAKYVIPITSPHIEDGAVLVRGQDIVEIGSAEELRRKYPDEPVRDYGLAALMPGFVDLHTHLGYTALRGMIEDRTYADWKRAVLRCEPFFTQEDWNDSALLGALEAVASGITTVADITSTGASVHAVQEIGLRGVIYREVYTMHADRAEEVVEQGVADIGNWRDDVDLERMSFGLAPGPVYGCHPKVFKAIADYAADGMTPVALHLAGSQEESDFVRYGSSPFSVHATELEQGLGLDVPPWLPAGTTPTRYVYNWGILDVPGVLAVHCIHVDDDDIEILKNNDVSIAYCPRIGAKLGMGAAPVGKFLEAGICVGLGTDSAAATDTIDVIDEMRIGLLLARAFGDNDKRQPKLTAREMLRMATIDAARALRLDGWIGSLEPGKKADIIAVDLHNSHQNPTTKPSNAIIYTANQDNVMMTMVGGNILYENFTHVSGVDRDGIVERARRVRQKIREGLADESLQERLIETSPEDRRERYMR